MFLIIPKKIEFETTLNPKRVARKLDGELTEFRPTLNVLAMGRFVKVHKFESLYYGRREGEKFQVYYHRFKKRDGGDTGFFGTVEKSEHGSVIKGKIRKPKQAYVFSIIWTLLTLLSALVCVSVKAQEGAWVCLALFLLGTAALFWDSKSTFLQGYLDGFPLYEEQSEKEE